MRSRGFTLLEMMVVCVVIAVLASIAYPSYISYVQKTRRAEAKTALLAAAAQMERYFTERSTYATATLGVGGVYDNKSENGAYTLALSALAATTYTLEATPVGAQAGDACGKLSYTAAGVKGVSGSKPVSWCW